MSFFRNAMSFLNGFRKLTIILLVLIITTVMLIFGFIDGLAYATILSAAVPSYMAGNVAEWVVREAATWIKEYKKE